MTELWQERSCPANCRASAKEWLPERLPEVFASLSFESRKNPEPYHYRQNLCSQCQMIFSSPVRDHAALYLDAPYSNRDGVAEAAAQTYAEVLALEFRELSREAEILDLGAGNGAWLRHLSRQGFRRLQGVEPSALARAEAPAALRLVGSTSALSVPTSGFDRIGCFQTLEHLFDPRASLEWMWRHLSPGGKVLLVCHDPFFPSNRWRRSPIYDVQHYQLLAPRALKNLVEVSGLRVERLRHFSNRYPLRYWARLLGLSTGTLGTSWKLSLPVGNYFLVATRK